MSHSEQSGVVSIGLTILMLALGAWFLFVAGAGLILRSQIAEAVQLGGDTVATAAAALGLLGLVALFMAYRISFGTAATSPQSTGRR